MCVLHNILKSTSVSNQMIPAIKQQFHLSLLEHSYAKHFFADIITIKCVLNEVIFSEGAADQMIPAKIRR